MEILDFLSLNENFDSLFKQMTMNEKLKIAAESDHLNNLGVMEFKNGDIQNAINSYEKALFLMPINDDALINLAACFNKFREYSKAISLCERAIKIQPDRAEGYRTIGDSFYYQSRMDQVVKWYTKSAKLGDESTYNWLINNGYSI